MTNSPEPAVEELANRSAAGDAEAVLQLAALYDRNSQYMDSLRVLADGANRGMVEPKLKVAERLLAGSNAPLKPADAVRLIAECVKEGSGAAAALAATLSGSGAYVPQSWPTALQLLQTAAERGFAPAQQQLALLAGQPSNPNVQSSDQSYWSQLRESIDLAAWVRPSQANIQLSRDPLVVAIRDFISDEICRWFVEKARGRLVRAEVYDALNRTNQVQDTRSNTTAKFGLVETDLIGLLTQARMSAATGIPFSHMEALAVLHYAPGEEITDHYDFVDPATPDYGSYLALNGQRVCTFLIYLNDDYAGGETEFTRLGITNKGHKREALYFINANSQGQPDLRTAHAGKPPTQGEKWIISQFIRSRPVIPGTAR